jgi:hypothetical protein
MALGRTTDLPDNRHTGSRCIARYFSFRELLSRLVDKESAKSFESSIKVVLEQHEFHQAFGS